LRKQASILILSLFATFASGQQLPIYSQYLFNKFLINPAVAGSDGYTSLNLTAREQWVGYDGAPRTFSFSAQTRVIKKGSRVRSNVFNNKVFRPKTDGRVGLGGYIFTDRNGLIQRTGFQMTYAYHMWIQSNTQFSMGLALTGYQYKIDEKAINFGDPNEPWLNNELRKGMFVPDVTFGMYLLNTKYSLGISAEQLFEASAKIGGKAYENFRIERHYYMFGSYDFSIGQDGLIEPSFILHMSEQLKPLSDMGVSYIYKQDLWAGLAYRTSGAVIVNAGVKYQSMYIGYAFDFTLQKIQRITYGTHEITLAFKLGDNSRKHRWIDRY
jgi:type IX secretion system PorP/SprF family membrane protein